MSVNPEWVGVSVEVQDSVIDIQIGHPPRHPTHAARAKNYIGWEMGGGPGGRDRWWLTRDGEAMAERIASFGRCALSPADTLGTAGMATSIDGGTS